MILRFFKTKEARSCASGFIVIPLELKVSSQDCLKFPERNIRTYNSLPLLPVISLLICHAFASTVIAFSPFCHQIATEFAPKIWLWNNVKWGSIHPQSTKDCDSFDLKSVYYKEILKMRGRLGPSQKIQILFHNS